MKVLILFALVSALVSNGWAEDLTCEQLENMGETGLRKMFVQEEGATIPKNAEEVETRCK